MTALSNDTYESYIGKTYEELCNIMTPQAGFVWEYANERTLECEGICRRLWTLRDKDRPVHSGNFAVPFKAILVAVNRNETNWLVDFKK